MKKQIVFCKKDSPVKQALYFKRWFIFPIIIISSILLLPTHEIWAQASLAAEDQIVDIPVEIRGEIKRITVVRDAWKKNQFYYFPPQPWLYERDVKGEKIPEFHLIRYQFKDPKNPEELIEAGLLQFSASLGIPGTARETMQSVIAKTYKLKKENVRIAAIPFKSAKVFLYNPKGELLTTGSQAPGIAPTISTQKMAFIVELTKVGADVYDELVSGKTGIGVVVQFTYNGLTPPAGFKVIVDYKQAHKHYSKDLKFKNKVSYYGLVSAKAEGGFTKIREELENSGALKIEPILGEGFKQEDADKMMQPILSRINEQIVKVMSPPEKVDPAKAGTPEADGFFGGIGFTASLKDVKQVKKIKETINYNVRQHVERVTTASGFIGIGDYSEELQKELVTIVPPGPWQSAFFVLPAVGDNDSIGISQVDLQVGLRHKDKLYDTQVVIWRGGDGWRDKKGNVRNVLAYPLMGLMADDPDATNYHFESKAKITLNNDVLELKKKLEVQADHVEEALTTPLTDTDLVKIDGDLLDWMKVSEEGKVSFVKYLLKSGEKSLNGTLKPIRVDGEWAPPNPAYWLLAKPTNGSRTSITAGSATSITADLLIKLKSGKKIKWGENGKNLREIPGGLQIILDDSDWQESDESDT